MTADGPLAQPVFAGSGYKAFGEFTLADVEARAAELTAATGWGRRRASAPSRVAGQSWPGR